ncbi:MAG: hypothetical protein ACLQNE_28300 [Thermoguttaceae bacterium]
MKSIRAILLMAIIACVLGGITLHYGWWPNPFLKDANPGLEISAEEPTRAEDTGRELRFMGWLEPADGILSISGTPGDRLEHLDVAEDAAVKQGQVLARLASQPIKQLQLDVLDCQIREAEARREAEAELAQTRIRSAELAKEKVEILASEATGLERKIDLLKDNRALAKKDFDRMRKLRAAPLSGDGSIEVVSEQELERQQLVVHQAETELAAAEAELRRLRATRDLSMKAAEADLKAARAAEKQAIAAVPVESLKKQREVARSELEYSSVKAPCKGKVLKIFMHEHESIDQRPILRMANLEQMVAVAEVYDVDAKRIQEHQEAILTSTAFHAPFDKTGIKGEVAWVGNMVNTPELRSVDPFAKVDRHVVPVRIRLKEGVAEAARFVGLQVEVEIRTTAGTKRP